MLYNTEALQIRFFEVKLFGDSRFSTRTEKAAEVVYQILRYNSQFEERGNRGQFSTYEVIPESTLRKTDSKVQAID